MNTVMPRAKALWPDAGKLKNEEQRPTAMLTVSEACRSLRISKWSLYRLMKSGKLEYGKIGTRTLIPADSIEKLVVTILKAQGY